LPDSTAKLTAEAFSSSDAVAFFALKYEVQTLIKHISKVKVTFPSHKTRKPAQISDFCVAFTGAHATANVFNRSKVVGCQLTASRAPTIKFLRNFKFSCNT
jgi:hypothetical protein